MTDERVLEAMATVRRHVYIPVDFLGIVPPYGDHPCPIGHSQTISQPFIVAYMTSRMNILPGEKVLEIGTGSGYQAAILAEMGADVYTIEIIPELAEHAREVLESEGYDSVHVLSGDGYLGWPEHAPFDAIIVTCAPEEVPEALVSQLADDGRMILPVGEDPYSQSLVVCRIVDGALTVEQDIPVMFVPMVHGESSP
jgi:protein-L-isoaspartate(D-aspartate) O-methyltransferase